MCHSQSECTLASALFSFTVCTVNRIQRFINGTAQNIVPELMEFLNYRDSSQFIHQNNPIDFQKRKQSSKYIYLCFAK